MLSNFSNIGVVGNRMCPVLINSMPKSGTNMLAKLLDLAGMQRRKPLSTGSNYAMFRLISEFFCLSGVQSFKMGIDTPYPVPMLYLKARLNRMHGSAYIESHVSDQSIIPIIQQYEFNVLGMVRSPYASLNSLVYYIQNNRNHLLHDSFESLDTIDKYRLVLKGGSIDGFNITSLVEKYERYIQWCDLAGACLVRFENLVGVQGGGSDELQYAEVSRIFSFLGVEDFDFESVSEKLYGPGKSTFRKGKIDSWETEIPMAIRSEIERELSSSDIMRKLSL